MDPKQEQQLLPTPEVGLPVRWYLDDMDTENYAAAFCTKIEAPGRIGVAVFSHNHTVSYKSGVHWIGDDRRLSPERPFRRNGCWDFVPSMIPRNATKLHKEELQRMAEAHDRQVAETQRIAAERARFVEERRKAMAESK